MPRFSLRLWGAGAPLGLAIALTVFGIDQAFKTWMLWGYDIAGRGRVALTPFLDLVLARNIGISYGLLPLDSIGGQIFLAAFEIAAALALWLWLVRAEQRLTMIAIALVIGGALGNALDRLIYHWVADFFLLHLNALGSDITWYVFNLADVAIVAGVAALLYESIALRRSTKSGEGTELREE